MKKELELPMVRKQLADMGLNENGEIFQDLAY